MPHLFKGGPAQVGDRVVDVDTNETGVIVGLDEETCRISVDYGKAKVTAPAFWFVKVSA